MLDPNKALEGLGQVASEIGRNILQPTLDAVLNSYQATMDGLSQAAPISILPDRTVPLIDTSIVMAHNAYNSFASGGLGPNQQLSLTELLDIGVRGLELDVYWVNDEARLCHLLDPTHTNNTLVNLAISYNRPLAGALSEVQTWLTSHPTETVILKFEDYLSTAPGGELAKVLRANLNTTAILTPRDLARTFNGNWPSINQMNALGKQIVLMPQNSGGDPNLFFDGNWGRRYKNLFNTGTIAKVRPNNLTIPRSKATELIEVGEDRTFFGSWIDSARKIPFLGRFLPDVAGQMTKEEIQQLRDNGVNLISLDQIERSDSRLTSSTTLANLRDSAYVFVPLAITAAALTPRDATGSLLQTTAQRALIQLLVATTLPDEGRVLYHAVDAGISSYYSTAEEAARADQIMTTLDKAKAVGYSLIPAIGKAAETTARIGLSHVAGQVIGSATSMPSTVLGTAAKTVAGVVAAKVVIDPLIGAATGAFKEHGVVEGFLQGVDSSTFGTTSFASKKDSTPQQAASSVPNTTQHRPLTRSMTRADPQETTNPASHQDAELRRRTRSSSPQQIQDH